MRRSRPNPTPRRTGRRVADRTGPSPVPPDRPRQDPPEPAQIHVAVGTDWPQGEATGQHPGAPVGCAPFPLRRKRLRGRGPGRGRGGHAAWPGTGTTGRPRPGRKRARRTHARSGSLPRRTGPTDGRRAGTAPHPAQGTGLDPRGKIPLQHDSFHRSGIAAALQADVPASVAAAGGLGHLRPEAAPGGPLPRRPPLPLLDRNARADGQRGDHLHDGRFRLHDR